MSGTNLQPRTAIYCRLSEEDKNKLSPGQDSLSISNQKSLLRQYAADHHWTIYDIYSDDDYTGADRKRPEFNRLLKDAEAGKFDIILCKTQSRFTRELELVEKYIHSLFPLWGIRFVSIVDNADTADKGNKKSRQINGLVNEWYLEDMSENIRSVLTDRRKNGYHIGAFALYGYKKDPDIRGHLLIDEEAASTVREVFSLFTQGYGKTAIARILNDRGIPNPTEYKRLHGLRYQQPGGHSSTLWSYSAIADMLVNEIYIGNMVQGKFGSVSYKSKANRPRPKDQWFIVKGTHEPIIDMESWNTVQTLIQQKSRPFSTGKIGIFAQKTQCQYCGHTMRSVKHKSGRRYLKCPTRQLSKDACAGAFISLEKLEKAVLAELENISAAFLDQQDLMKKIPSKDHTSFQTGHLKKTISSCQKSLAEYSKYIRDLYMDKVKGIVSEADFLDLSKAFSEEKERMEQQLLKARQQLLILEKTLPSNTEQTPCIEEYIHPRQLNRTHVELMIDHIQIGKKNPDTNEIPIKIYWNF